VRLGQLAGFDGHDARLGALLEFALDEGEGDAGRSSSRAARAADDDVGLFAGEFHLLDRFLADDGLMQADVIENAAEAAYFGSAW